MRELSSGCCGGRDIHWCTGIHWFRGVRESACCDERRDGRGWRTGFRCSEQFCELILRLRADKQRGKTSRRREQHPACLRPAA